MCLTWKHGNLETWELELEYRPYIEPPFITDRVSACPALQYLYFIYAHLSSPGVWQLPYGLLEGL